MCRSCNFLFDLCDLCMWFYKKLVLSLTILPKNIIVPYDQEAWVVIVWSSGGVGGKSVVFRSCG